MVMVSPSITQEQDTNSAEMDLETSGSANNPTSCPVENSFSPFLSKFSNGTPTTILTGGDNDLLTTRGFKNWVDYVLLLASKSVNILPPELNPVRNHFIGQKDYKILYAGLTEDYAWSHSPNCDNWAKLPSLSDPMVLSKQAGALIGTNLVINDPKNSMKLIESGQVRFDFAFLHHGFRPLVNSWISSHNTRVLLEKILATNIKADAALNNRAKDLKDPICGCAQVPKQELLEYLGLKDLRPDELSSAHASLPDLQSNLNSIQKDQNDLTTSMAEVFKVQADQAAQISSLMVAMK